MVGKASYTAAEVLIGPGALGPVHESEILLALSLDHARLGARGAKTATRNQSHSGQTKGEPVMTERRKPRPASAVLRGKMRQIEERLGQLEDQIKALRVEATRTTGLARIKIERLERRATAQLARARTALAESAGRLHRALADAKTREDVARHVATARAALERSLDRLARTLADSGKSVKQEMGLLTRGLKAGIRAGSEAYRRKRS